MYDLYVDAMAFLRDRFPQSLIINVDCTVPRTTFVKSCRSYTACDFDRGVKQATVAIPKLDAEDARIICADVEDLWSKIEGPAHVARAHEDDPADIWSSDLPRSGVLVLFTDTLGSPTSAIRAAAPHVNLEIVDRGRRRPQFDDAQQGRTPTHDSVFISYGGPDEAVAGRINRTLKGRSVKTCIFKDDALPGQKLHRFMSDGVRDHDRVLFLCSKGSLSRPGVLNELERVLEREAREGGADILMPIRLDDHVLGDWAPARRDVADQVRSRVIGDFTGTDADPAKFKAEMEKVFRALSRAGRET